MKISAIQSPIISLIKRPDNITFVSRPDNFVKSEFDFDKEVDVYYSKLQKLMEVVTPQDIVLQANRISKKTGVKLDDVYETMGLLSQYSSYKSLSVIEENLQKHDIKYINNLKDFYKANKCGVPICLTNVLHYISLKNFGFKAEFNDLSDDKKALFVDSNLINIAQNDYAGDTELFYIENFENGYNFLNQSKSFEDYTMDIIEKAKSIQNYTGRDFSYNVHYVLNGYVEENINDVLKGGHINVIRTENVCTPEKIADNLNPIMPDYKSFKEVLDDIANQDLVSRVNGEKCIVNSLNNIFEPVTPKQLTKYLQEMHVNITKYLKDNNKDLDKVYYVIPNKNKSFALINYQYQKANHIYDMQTYIMNRASNGPEGLNIKTIPQDASLIVLDDYMLSGLSMLREQFPYETLIFTDALFKNKNISIVFAPVFATKKAMQDFNKLIDNSGRSGKDCIIPAKVFPEYNNKNLLKELFPAHKYVTSTVMPYMGPDSNLEEFVPLCEKFLYSPFAQKTPIDMLDFTPLE